MGDTIYIYIYISFTHAVANKTTTVQPKMSSSNDDSGVRYCFDTYISLTLTQNAPKVSYNKTRLCQFSITLWECQIKIQLLCCIHHNFPVTKY